MARKKKSDEEQPINENLGNQSDSDDTFGLPDIEYKPLVREEESPVSTSSVAQEREPEVQSELPKYEYQQKSMEQNTEISYEPDDDEENPVWPKVLGILLVIGLLLGGVWFFMWYKPAQEEKDRLAKEKIELEAKQKADQDAKDRAEQARLAEEQRVADSLANASKVGTIETLSERTGRYYVVAASAVDDDLLMDHAKKLSTKGVSIKIIPPFGKYKLFRLAIADGDTFASAQEVANSKKAEFGDAVWVLKY